MRPLIILILSCKLFAANYYVAANGSDSNSGTTATTPWLTLAKVNGSTFSPGDAVFFRCGDTWTGVLVPPSSGTPGHVIIFGNYTPTICTALPVLVGNGTDPTVNETKNYVTIQDLKVTGGGFGVSAQADSIHDVTVQRTEITGNHSAGLLLANVFNQTVTASTNLNAYSNFIHDNGGHGIQYLFRVQLSTASANTIGGNGTIPGVTGWHGISAYGIGNGADPSLLTWNLNNVYGTIWTPQFGEGAGIQADNNSSFITISGNYVHGNGGYGIAAATPSGHITIAGNSVCGNGRISLLPGIVVNNSHDDLIALNTVSGNGTGVVIFSTNSVNLSISNNSIANNGVMEISRNDAASGLVSNFNNIYHAAAGTYMSWNGVASDIAGWRTISGQDINSTSNMVGACNK